MTRDAERRVADFIKPLNINSLEGRMLVIPTTKGRNRKILFIYGQHSSLERWWGLIQELNRYGEVIVPDLPGFGGMQSLYEVGSKPTIDNMADYLADFIKLQLPGEQLTLMGLSLGFPIITRMLQRHPGLVEKVDLLVSVVGFARFDEFTFSKSRNRAYRYGASLFVHRPFNLVLSAAINPKMLRYFYHRSFNAKDKFVGKSGEAFEKTMDAEIKLWKQNDVRTWTKTTSEMFVLDNCQTPINLPVWHVSVKNDKYFNQKLVKKHFLQIFTDYHQLQSKAATHGPSIIATAKEAAPMIPSELRQLLAKA
jgi:pimeloyl-ACP methyl ester carboxylesterase